MGLPADVSTVTLDFGAYLDAAGRPAYVGMVADVTPVDPVTRKPIAVRHVSTGDVIVETPVQVTIGEDGTGSIVLPHTDQDSLSVVGFAYSVRWRVPYGAACPGHAPAIALPVGLGATADFDTLSPAPAVPGVLVPIQVGPQGPEGPQGPAGSDATVTPDAVAANLPDRLSTAALNAAYGSQTRVLVDGVYVPELDIDSTPPTVPSCRIFASVSGQPFGQEAWDAVQFDTTEYNDDPDLFAVSPGKNPAADTLTTLLITVQEAGLYLIDWGVTFYGGGAGQRAASLSIGANAAADSGGTVPDGGWILAGRAVTRRLPAGAILGVTGYTEVGAGAPTEVQGSALGFETGLTVTRLGA